MDIFKIYSSPQTKKFEIKWACENVFASIYPRRFPLDFQTGVFQDKIHGSHWHLSLVEKESEAALEEEELHSDIPQVNLILTLDKLGTGLPILESIPISVKYKFQENDGLDDSGLKMFGGFVSFETPEIISEQPIQLPEGRNNFTLLITIYYETLEVKKNCYLRKSSQEIQRRYSRYFKEKLMEDWKDCAKKLIEVPTPSNKEQLVVIKTPDGEVEISEMFLLGTSDVFGAELYGPLNELRTRIISMPKFDIATVKRMVEFCVSGQLDSIKTCTGAEAFQLLQLSTQYLISGLKELSEMRVAQSITLDDAITLYKFLKFEHWRGMEVLSIKLEQFMTRNALAIIQSDEFMEEAKMSTAPGIIEFNELILNAKGACPIWSNADLLITVMDVLESEKVLPNKPFPRYI